jgi:hypothetical protein
LTLSFEAAEQLRAAGFLDYEIEQFATAVDPEGKPQPPVDITTPVWQRAMRSRRDWIEDKISRGWTETEIREELMNYYRRGEKRSPWDFLRVEYRSPQRIDYREAVRRRAQARITAVLGRY